MHVMIWGTGEYAVLVKAHIDYVNNCLGETYYSIVCYIDNDILKQGEFYDKKVIIHPSELQKEHVPIIIGVYNDTPVVKQINEEIGGIYYTFFDFVYRDIIVEENIRKWIPEFSAEPVFEDVYEKILNRERDVFWRKLILQKVIQDVLAGRLTIDFLHDLCDTEEIIAALFGLCANKLERAQETEKRLQLQIQNIKKGKPKTIAFYYTRYANGGVERVLSHHMKMFVQAGYQVIFLSDEISDCEDYELAQGVIRIVLNGKKQGNMYQWFTEVSGVLKQYDVDMLISHQSYWEANYYLNRLAKIAGCGFIIEIHNVFKAFALDNVKFFKTLYQNADAVVCLSEADRKFWSVLGVDSYYIPNPVVNDSRNSRMAFDEPKDVLIVLWVGRLEEKQKNIQDVVDIAMMVKESLPDVQFQIVGKFENRRLEYSIKDRIKKLGLQDSINFMGYYKDTSVFYLNADAMILTSGYEGFPMVVAEAMAFGVPVVTYAMPYLELFRDRKGFIEVPQRDTERMAEELVTLLKDDAVRHKLSEEAKEVFLKFAGVNLLNKWECLFDMRKKNDMVLTDDEKDYINIINLILERNMSG